MDAAEEAGTECFAMHSGGTEIVLARTPVRGAKRVFQVACSTMLAIRAHLLRRDGYDVTSARGNGIAQFVLQARPPSLVSAAVKERRALGGLSR